MNELPPIVGIACDRRMIGDHAFHMVGEKYIAAVRDGVGALPFLIPVLDPPISSAELLANLDGLLFTGSMSNVAPHHYGGHPPRNPSLLDEARDAITLPLMRAAESAAVPMFCICRGFQELNVAFGGTLHQHLNEIDGFQDHSVGDRKRSLERQYGPVHDVRVAPGGVLEHIIPGMPRFQVNSLHSQGIDRLAPPLRVEATAPDGAIEAVSMDRAKAFLFGVQWHPEWKHAENEVSKAIFSAFGAAVRDYAQKRRGLRVQAS
jgi:putative glutamine amidotransferase